MSLRHIVLSATVLGLLALACNLPLIGAPPTGTPSPATLPLQPLPPEPLVSSTAELPVATEAILAEGPPEAILILEPGPGSRLTSPLRVAGLADSTFEQHLLLRLVLDDGTEIAAGPVIIQSEFGTRGPFEGELAFIIAGERNALLQVSSQSARDGGITHLTSVGVTLAATGPVQVLPAAPHFESLQITAPQPGDTASGGIVHVEGTGLASFEGTLVIEVYDEQGNLIGSMPVLVDAPEMGLPGPFSADVPYSLAVAGFGRITVVDPLPAFDGLGHIASVEVRLLP
ncbi:MAG: Gmad2 immunoglobulin-like domain-containing protein [Anaerolineales bacterium]